MTTKTKKKRKINKDNIDHDDIFYIRQHQAMGITKERIAANVHCDLEDIEQIDRRYHDANIQNIG